MMDIKTEKAFTKIESAFEKSIETLSPKQVCELCAALIENPNTMKSMAERMA